ncbi:RNA-binding protein 12B-like isoform X1 [Ranitomeya imitator]|uniref:RNA-binding protein 12B-like isoform X1 n=1 Tax=Ranitomeya imitator TaxID=111125 RepID=UPI0037E7C74D
MSWIVQLKGLPAMATSSDIREFFCGLHIPRGGVSIIGGIYGEAYIVFSTHDDARKAVNLSGHLLKDSFVYLEYANEGDMREALELVQIGLKSSLTSSSNSETAPKSPEKDNVPSVYLYVRGLPIEATWTDIQEFFTGLCVEDILFLRLYDGCKSGKAFIKFGSESDAKEALKFNYKPLRFSPVVLKLSNEEEWKENGGDHIAKRERSPKRSTKSRSRSPKTRVTRKGAVYVQEYYVHLLNLSIESEKSDIMKLFSDLYMKDAQINFLVDKQGKRTTEGFVMFKRERDYKRALSFNKETFMGCTLNVVPISKGTMCKLIDHMKVSACNDRPDNGKSPSRSSQERSDHTDKEKSPSRSSQEFSNHTDGRKSPSRSSQDRNKRPDRKRSRSRSSQGHNKHPDRKRSRSRSSQKSNDRRGRRRSRSRSSQKSNDRRGRRRSRSQSSQKSNDHRGRRRSRSRSSQKSNDRRGRRRSRSRSSQKSNDRRGRRRSRSRSSRDLIYKIDRRSPERRCLYLRNFPCNVSKSDIRKFFTGKTVKDDDIYLLHDEKTEGLGDVLVTYSNEKEAFRAEKENEQTHQGIQILIIRITSEQANGIKVSERIRNVAIVKPGGLSGIDSESLPRVGASAAVQTSTPVPPVQASLPVEQVAQVHTIAEPSALEEVGVRSHSDIVPISGPKSAAGAASDMVQTTPVTQSSPPPQCLDRVTGCNENTNCDAKQTSSEAALLVMRNLPVSITATEILDFFRDFKVSSVNLQNIENGEATVFMMNKADALSAIDTCNNGVLSLRRVSLSLI